MRRPKAGGLTLVQEAHEAVSFLCMPSFSLLMRSAQAVNTQINATKHAARKARVRKHCFHRRPSISKGCAGRAVFTGGSMVFSLGKRCFCTVGRLVSPTRGGVSVVEVLVAQGLSALGACYGVRPTISIGSLASPRSLVWYVECAALVYSRQSGGVGV